MSDNSDKMLIGCLGVVCIAFVFALIAYFVIAGLTYLVCLGFGLEWSWTLALGIYALITLFALVASFMR